MNEFFKFPITRHLLIPDHEDVRVSKAYTKEETETLLLNKVIIEEKIDGANLGISFNPDGKLLLQNRGAWLQEPWEGQWKILGNWLRPRMESLFDHLLDRYILFGEWCYAVHSVFYDALPDFFVGFDIFDKKEKKFFSVSRRDALLQKMDIAIVWELGEGIYSLEDLKQFFATSHYGSSLCEGIYIRREEDGWLKQRAKLVRKDFRQSIERHWSKQKLKMNKIEVTDK